MGGSDNFIFPKGSDSAAKQGNSICVPPDLGKSACRAEAWRRLADALRCLDGGRSIMRVTAMLICLVVLGAGSRWDGARGDGTKYRTLAESSKDAGHRTIVQEIKVVYRSAPTYSNVLSSGNAYVYSDALFKGVRAAAGGMSESKTAFFGAAICTQKTKFYV